LPKAAKAVAAAKELGKKVATGADKAKAKVKAVKEPAPRPAKAAAKSAPAASKAAAKATPATKAKKAASGKAPADKFLQEQLVLLEAERATYEEQAEVLKAQADQMAQEMEPGDIQFDDESGEGATANIDRERDLALSAQARVAVDEIDYAIAKIGSGTYGRCEGCGQPIPKARLKALPQARLCVACKSGGLSRR
jgi:DnaK suppressor protein